MLKVSSITNVKNTINRNSVNFKSGIRSNYGADVVNNTSNLEHEGTFLTDFLGTIKQSPLFYETFYQRQMSIEKALQENQNIDVIA